MVQHREANAAGELCVCEWHRSGITLDDPNIAAVQASSERFRQLSINFDRRQMRHSLPQEIGGQAKQL
jgi:hypothetical protein